MGRVLRTSAVLEVLLADDWHRVADGSFTLEGLEIIDRDGRVPLLLEIPGHGFPNEAAFWREPSGTAMMCPLTSVLALKFSPDVAE